MNFLNPALLAALGPLLLLPLAIHLFNRRFPRTILFPDLERIRRSLAERSQLARWRHLLMTALRTLVVLLALLAFLKPVLPRFGSDPSARAPGEGRLVLLVLDRSHSMEHLTAGGVPASRRVLLEAGKILATLGPGDRANAVLAGLRASALLPEPTGAHERLRAAIAALPPALDRADVPKALRLAAALLGEGSKGAEVYFLSDFQRSNWADVSFEELPASTRLFFVDVSGGADRPNTALLSLASPSREVSVGEKVRLDLVVGNWTPDAATLPIEVLVGGSRSYVAEVPAEAWATARASVVIEAPREGLLSIEARLPGDALPGDDRRHLALEVRRREEILVVSDRPAEDTTASGAVFVAIALDPFDDRSGAYDPRVVPMSALGSGRLAAAAKLVLTGVGPIPPETATRLATFLERGGGIVYFLDGAADAENLKALDAAAGRPFLPLALSGRLGAEHFGGRPQQIARGQFDSRFLRLFRGENRAALARLEFYEIHRAFPTGQGEVLLSFADGTPAMGHGELGLGGALLCNFTPGELSSNLARQRLFPAWMQELVRELVPGSAHAEGKEVGQAITAELWRQDLAEHPPRGPDGQPVAFQIGPTGERVPVSLEAALPGFYSAGPPGRPVWLEAVNLSPAEADLRSIDPAELSRRAGEAPPGSGYFVEGAEDYAELVAGRPVWHWFLLGLALALALEMLLQRRFRRFRRSPAPAPGPGPA
jgi:hypothetical protein